MLKRQVSDHGVQRKVQLVAISLGREDSVWREIHSHMFRWDRLFKIVHVSNEWQCKWTYRRCARTWLWKPSRSVLPLLQRKPLGLCPDQFYRGHPQPLQVLKKLFTFGRVSWNLCALVTWLDGQCRCRISLSTVGKKVKWEGDWLRGVQCLCRREAASSVKLWYVQKIGRDDVNGSLSLIFC
jgi:hypothetical protein